MSKRNSLGSGGSSGGNTLFKYFTKSPGPATPKTPKPNNESSPSIPTKKTESFGTPTSTKSIKLPEKNSKKRSIDDANKSQNMDEDGDADTVLSVNKKRSRLLIVDSDSDQENSNDTNYQCKSDVTTSSNKQNSSADKDESTAKKMKMDNNKPMPATMSFQEKLKCIGSSHDNNLESFEASETMIDDEPIVWTHNKIDFLKPQNIKDKYGRRPIDPNYDNTTLLVPKSYLDQLTPGVRQWWEIKIDHFDCVLFFKVGKFYELYHMDADIGVQELGFTYMKGDFAHSGFPEQSYDRMATSLVARGYKVARIEQTETPDMMQDRIKNMKKPTKFDKVVKREVCQITNRGTEVFGQQVAVTNNHQANYMLAIAEKPLRGHTSRYGICFIDTSLGEFHIGEFDDDKQCSRLLTLLSHYPPALVLSERNALTPHTQQIFKNVLSNAIKEQLTNDTQFWSSTKTLKILAEKYYISSSSADNQTEWPPLIKSLQDPNDHLGLTAAENYDLALRALGATIWYMTKCLIDEQIMSMAEYVIYLPPDNYTKTSKLENVAKILNKSANHNRNMVLDSVTLSNLKVCNSEYSLLSALDHCCTKFGKRLLNYWVCTPSCTRDTIIERQDAIQELMKNHPLLEDIRTLLVTLPDLERLLVQIHSFGNAKRKKNHPDGRAVMFEQKIYNKKKIQDFISTLRGFESLLRIPKMFSKCSSQLLLQLTQHKPNGNFPKMEDTLKFFQTGFNHEAALREGVIAPEMGVDQDFDSAVNEIESIEKELAHYLKKQEKHFGCRIAYFGNDKKRFQLEIPENNAKRADDSYYLEGQRKGAKPVKRFHTDETRDFLKRMLEAEDDKNAALNDLSRRMFEKFSVEYNLWKLATELTATLDVLTSLATYANNQSQLCFPVILSNENGPILELEDGYHPCMRLTEDFIPNGIKLGCDDNTAPLILLTGPNMGGKSTLMRQIGLLIIMSQMGCPIPATSCRLSLVDRIFTRLGAQDDIMAGHSTFLVELNETSAILKHSTINSLVLLDELGRGTATYDGTAIAASVVNFLANVKCRTIFSTHYHNLVDNFTDDKRISFGHMACMVENEDEDDPTQETVTFLYKYSNGPCPKSYGFNAAKLAGMPMNIIRRAHELSKKVEATAVKHKLFSKMIAGDKCDLIETKELLHKLKLCTIK